MFASRFALRRLLPCLLVPFVLVTVRTAKADFTYTSSWTVGQLKNSINSVQNGPNFDAFCGTPASDHTTNCGFFDFYASPQGLAPSAYTVTAVSAPSTWVGQTVSQTLYGAPPANSVSGDSNGNFARFVFNSANPADDGTPMHLLTSNTGTVGQNYLVDYPNPSDPGNPYFRNLTGAAPLANSDVFSVTIRTASPVNVNFWNWLGSYVQLNPDGSQQELTKPIVNTEFVTPEPGYLIGTGALFVICLLLARQRAVRRRAA